MDANPPQPLLESRALDQPRDTDFAAASERAVTLPDSRRGVRLSVEQQATDPRGSQVQCTVRVENGGATRVAVLSLQPLLPLGATMQKEIDISLSEAEVERKALCDDLSGLATDVLAASSDSYRRQLADKLRDSLNEAFSARGLLNAYVRLLFRSSPQLLQRAMTMKRWQIAIRSAEQAQRFYDRHLRPLETAEPALTEVFRSRIEQLRDTEARIGKTPNLDRIADVEPGDSFARTYVLQCERRFASPKTYTFAFNCTYGEDAPAGMIRRQLAASLAATITPQAMVVSGLAMAAALLGALLKIALDASQAAGSGDLAAQLGGLVTMGNLALMVAAMITALFFYNIYDATEVGKKLNIGTGWRSALLIGGLSGLLNERVVAALRGLLG